MNYPRCTEEVVKVINTCRESSTTIVSSGMGSGVVCGIKAASGIVVIDLSNFNKIRMIDVENLMATLILIRG